MATKRQGNATGRTRHPTAADVYTDATQRPELADTLASERLALATDAAGIGIWDWNLQTNEWFGTPTYFAMLGHPPSYAFAPREVAYLGIHPDDRDKVRALTQAVRVGETSTYVFQAQMLHADGSWRWVEVNGQVVARDAAGLATRLVGVRTDITAVKRAQQAATAAESYFRTLFELSPVPALRATWPERRLVDANPAFAALTGYDRSELQELPLGMRAIWLDPSEHLRYLLLLEADGVVRDFDFELLAKDGSVKSCVLFSDRFRHGEQEYVLTKVLDRTAKRQAFSAVAWANARLHSLSQRLLTIQENERRQLAQELHDEVAQTLAVAKLKLQGLQAAQADPGVADALDVVTRVLGQVRSLTLQLRPPLLDDLGLEAALDWLVAQRPPGVAPVVEFFSNSVPRRYPSGVEIACFRVAQEAIHNAEKHAQARRVLVGIEVVEDVLHLRVRDDGVGMSADAARLRAGQGKSLGILGMTERAALAGGSIIWQSDPGDGTEVHAQFPLDAASTAPTEDEVSRP